MTAARALESDPVKATDTDIGGLPLWMMGRSERAAAMEMDATSSSTFTSATSFSTAPSNAGVAASTSAAAAARTFRWVLPWLRIPWCGMRSPWVCSSHVETARALSPASSRRSISGRLGELQGRQRALYPGPPGGGRVVTGWQGWLTGLGVSEAATGEEGSAVVDLGDRAGELFAGDDVARLPAAGLLALDARAARIGVPLPQATTRRGLAHPEFARHLGDPQTHLCR